jgi:hypothetical protein
MADYLLQEDRLIGHKIVIQKKGLFKRKLFLKGVYYNDLINSMIEAGDLDDLSLEYGYRLLSDSIQSETTKNFWDNIYQKKKCDIKKSCLEKKVDALQYRFTDSYLKKALEILEETKLNVFSARLAYQSAVNFE